MHFIMSAVLAVLLVTGNPAAAAGPAPWTDAAALLKAVEGELNDKGLAALSDRAPQMERALAGAAAAHAEAERQGIYLTDGMPEAIAAMALGAKAHPKMTVSAVDDPYPILSFYLGSYYDEVSQPEEALRVLDAGIAIPRPLPGLEVDAHRPILYIERGAALTALRRSADALASYDKALSLTEEGDAVRGPILRGRGFSLTELGRLDEAEQAYRDSLKIDPDNKIALRELQYIAQLKQGGKKGTPEITLPNNGGK